MTISFTGLSWKISPRVQYKSLYSIKRLYSIGTFVTDLIALDLTISLIVSPGIPRASIALKLK